MLKHNVHLYNCIELDFSNLNNEDYIIKVSRQMAPVFVLGKINQFKTANSFIIVNDYKSKITSDLNVTRYDIHDFSNDKPEYDNIYFKDFVLTNCFLVEMDDDLYILSDKVTLI